MAAPTTKFKQLLYDALSTPQVKVFSTKADAHKARFAMYDSMRKMRKETPPDPYGEMKDVLEFLIKELPTGQAELRIQPKSTRLVECLDDWISEGTSTQPPPPSAFTTPTPAHRPAPPPPVDLTALSQQLINETPKEIDPTNPEDALLLQQADISAWMNELDERLPSDKARQALVLRQQAGPTATLEEVKALLSSHGIH